MPLPCSSAYGDGTAGGVVPLCNMPMRPAKPTFDSVGHNFFEKSLRMMMENENDTLAARALERFEAEKQRQGDDAARSQYLETTLLTQRKSEERGAEHNRLTREVPASRHARTRS